MLRNRANGLWIADWRPGGHDSRPGLCLCHYCRISSKAQLLYMSLCGARSKISALMSLLCPSSTDHLLPSFQQLPGPIVPWSEVGDSREVVGSTCWWWVLLCKPPAGWGLGAGFSKEMAVKVGWVYSKCVGKRLCRMTVYEEASRKERPFHQQWVGSWSSRGAKGICPSPLPLFPGLFSAVVSDLNPQAFSTSKPQ